MAQNGPQPAAINIECVCGHDLAIAQDLMGRTFPCPFCGRYLRAALQFVMVNQEVAPNLTAICTCGRFIMEKPKRAGKKTRCGMCGRRVVLPKPVEKEGPQGVARISAAALEKQLRMARDRRKKRAGTVEPTMGPPRTTEQFHLQPGQEVCPNEECGMPLPSGSNVCPRCAMNLRSRGTYEAAGPEADPVGKWKDKWARS